MQNTQIYHINKLIENFDRKVFEDTADVFIIFCDDNIKKLYGLKLLENFKSVNIKVFLISFKSGEINKNRKTKAELEDKLFELNIGKECAFIALGGGVTSDLIGFLAATYLRGVKVIYIPTTLLAMVDAVIGGKVAVNASFGKNLIGSFYSPLAVLIDPSFLNTLPADHLMNGYVEMLKHGLVHSYRHFQLVKESFIKREIPNIELILESIEIKQKIVAQDYLDKGIRKVLNFGHTFAHALESLSNFKISHGRAVAIGILMESYISFKMSLLNESDFLTVLNTFEMFKLKKKYTFFEWKSSLKFDKKNKNNSIEFIALNGIGKAAIHSSNITYTLSDEMLQTLLSWIDNFLI